MSATPSILAFSVAAIDDLAWFYQASECELGLSSACGLMLDRMRDGTQGVVYASDPSGSEDGRLEAMELHRNVRELLWRVGKRIAGHLARLHEPRQWSPALVRAFGSGAPLAAVTKAARDAYKLETSEKAPRSESIGCWLEMTLCRGKRIDRMTSNAVAVESRQLREEGYLAFEHERARVTANEPGERSKRYPYMGRRAVVRARTVQAESEKLQAELAVAALGETDAIVAA
jgi:hypothetical protein